ncbi:hypothetical protein ID0562_12500 [Helicobacter pylori]
MFKDFYRTTFSFLKPLLLLLGLLLPFSLCIADGYISISPTWDEYTQKYKTYYFENGLTILIKANTSKPLMILERHKNTALGLAVFI